MNLGRIHQDHQHQSKLVDCRRIIKLRQNQIEYFSLNDRYFKQISIHPMINIDIHQQATFIYVPRRHQLMLRRESNEPTEKKQMSIVHIE